MSDDLILCGGCGRGTYACWCEDPETLAETRRPTEAWRGVPTGVLADLADDAGFDPSECC